MVEMRRSAGRKRANRGWKWRRRESMQEVGGMGAETWGVKEWTCTGGRGRNDGAS